MRTLTDHKLNGLNDALEITVTDEPGSGALTELENALMRLQKRTRDRMARGVEGTMQK